MRKPKTLRERAPTAREGAEKLGRRGGTETAAGETNAAAVAVDDAASDATSTSARERIACATKPITGPSGDERLSRAVGMAVAESVTVGSVAGYSDDFLSRLERVERGEVERGEEDRGEMENVGHSDARGYGRRGGPSPPGAHDSKETEGELGEITERETAGAVSKSHTRPKTRRAATARSKAGTSGERKGHMRRRSRAVTARGSAEVDSSSSSSNIDERRTAHGNDVTPRATHGESARD